MMLLVKENDCLGYGFVTVNANINVIMFFSMPMTAMTSATCQWICLWFGTETLSSTTPTTSKVSSLYQPLLSASANVKTGECHCIKCKSIPKSCVLTFNMRNYGQSINPISKVLISQFIFS